MTSLAWLIPSALALGLMGSAAFYGRWRSGQFEDLEGAGWRAIEDGDPGSTAAPDEHAESPCLRPRSYPGLHSASRAHCIVQRCAAELPAVRCYCSTPRLPKSDIGNWPSCRPSRHDLRRDGRSRWRNRGWLAAPRGGISFGVMQWAAAVSLMWMGLVLAGAMPSLSLLDRE